MDPREQAEPLAGASARSPSVSTGRGALDGRRALVVGGTGGIGRCVSEELALRGAQVFIHGRSPGRVQSALADLRAKGALCEGFAAPISAPKEFLAALESATGFPEGFDAIALCFGPFVRKTIGAHDAQDWSDMALLDLALPGALASRAFPAMAERGFGRMLFFGGTRTDAVRAYRSNVAYAAAKTGLGVLVKSIAAEGAPRNVAAVLVCPGLVRTEYLSEEEAEALEAMAPGGLLQDPQSVARTAVDLIDADPCPASGAIVSLDGGFSP